VDGVRIGRSFRAIRIHLGLRQTDVAATAGVSQGVVSLIERGRIEMVSVRNIEAVAAVLGATVRIEARWRGGDLDRLLDRDHARVAEFVASELPRPDWLLRPEYEFNRYGDRGSVDLLAWHPKERVLLIVEVKTRLTDLQATLASYARKLRVVPQVVEEREGWDVARVGRLLVVIGSTANRAIVANHPTIFDASFPQRGHEVRRWLRSPRSTLGGLWFIAPSTLVAGKSHLRSAQRIRTASRA
jgi:transcriptional regulator with XRE-family HTH domain